MPVGTKLEKAYLALIKPPTPTTSPPRLSAVLAKARSDREGEVVFTFNPNEFTIAKQASWESRDQRSAATTPMPEFKGPKAATLSLEIFLDDTDQTKPRVAKQVQQLMDAVTPLRSTINENRPSPPWAVFGWGTFISFVAIVKEVSAKYTLFTEEGTPVRAVCTVKLEEVPTDPPPRQNPTSGGTAPTRTHTVVAGDSLPLIAQVEYADPNRWRDIAELNNIDDPLRVPPGTRLMVAAPSQLEPVGEA